MILKNKMRQVINALIREQEKMVLLSIPAGGHSREFDKSSVTQDVLNKVNRGYLLIYEEPLQKRAVPIKIPVPQVQPVPLDKVPEAVKDAFVAPFVPGSVIEKSLGISAGGSSGSSI